MAPPSQSRPEGETGLATRALRLLARRDHTRLELAQKLARYAADAATLQAVLDDLAARGWLSERRVLEQVVHAKRDRYGPARLREMLLGRGVSAELVDAELDQLRSDEVDRARRIWSRKFGVPPASAAERARQVRFLQGRGYSLGVALRVVSGEPS